MQRVKKWTNGSLGTVLALSCLTLPLQAAPVKPGDMMVLSTGKTLDIGKHRTPELPTVFVFLKPNSTLESDFLKELRSAAGPKVSFGVIELKTGMEPVARQYEILQTPTALVYDRRGRLVTRSSKADDIRAAITKAASVMRIDWAEEGEPRFEEGKRLLGGRPLQPGIMRTMSLQPTWMASIRELSQKSHFTEGFLDRRIKEMIATYVSALNKCKY
jgi:hypothetical protein